MKVLTNEQLKHISGAGNLVVTQLIPTDGISDACVGLFVQTFQAGNTLTDEHKLALILSTCTFGELDILADRLDAITPIKVDFN